jgi:ABC-2 type transport system ATP-binding protein
VTAPAAPTIPTAPAIPSRVAAPARTRPAARSTAVRRASAKRVSPTAPEIALSVSGLTKTFGNRTAVSNIDLSVNAGSFFGFVGPNGAGKTTTLSMVSGLLRPDAGVVKIYSVDVWENAAIAKRSLGVLPDRLRLFDRLTGSEFLHHAGALRGLDRQTITRRVADLERAFGIEHSAKRLVSDYSAGMVKKIAIAAAMIHSPRLLVLDEPFESVDPVSAEVVIDILKKFAKAGGTVVLSSHSMDLIERVCDAVAIIADGRVLASGPIGAVLAGKSLEDRFVELAGGATAVEGMEWLQSFSD